MLNKNKGMNVAVVGIFAALIIVLQFVSSTIMIGNFSITLTLVPIVFGAILYGYKVGAALGGIFGVIVVICCIIGLEKDGATLMQAKPILTTVVCMCKGILAGVLPGFVFKAVGQKHPYLGTVLAAIVAPIGNTGLFLICMVIFFRDMLTIGTSGAATVYYIFTGLVSINFIIEMIINIVAAPALYRAVQVVKRI